ncbi:MobF family relaxase [Xenorhabdus bovienii]|uniref:Mobilization protein TraI n=1 Tax=Xenorhabdus bovienii str. feltiae Moldova TaxID=1398200 RepID=A0A077NV60_XENBV|nr:MobF family relaxase [Xenorhabdus bovienii]CDH02243.1 Mobilization protein TraI [Xenorhabdus bovienii str. feltiae Moldova]
MLSIKKIGNIKEAGNYYLSHDSYYNKDTGEVHSEWGGKGAEELGLSGTVDTDRFIELLEGKINGNTQLGRTKVNGDLEHVPGWDFTFSAPKGASILALVGDDKRLIQAHQESVIEAMKFLEKNYAATRTYKDGKTHIEKVDNLLYASFMHTESRSNDPQLHTHNPVINAVLDSEGKWKSLEPIEMYRAKMMAGLVYRSSYASKARGLGYEIEVTDRDKGFFDVKGVPDSLKGSFSKRRQQIQAAINQRGLFDQKSIEKATLFTRDKKTTINQDERNKIWKSTVAESGFDIDLFISNAKEQQIQQPETKEFSSKEDISQQENRGERGMHDNTGAASSASEDTNESTKATRERPEVNNSFYKEHNEQSEAFEEKADTDGFTPIQERLESSNHQEYDSQSLNDVRLAYKVLAENESVFSYTALLTEALKLRFGLENSSKADIDLDIDALIDVGELIPRTTGFTTKDALSRERFIVTTMLNGKDTYQAIGDLKGIKSHIDTFEQRQTELIGKKFNFSDDQHHAIQNMLLSKDLVSGIQGYAGTGKTTLLSCVIEYATNQGYTIKGLAPTGSAVETLHKDTGIAASTVDSYLFTRKPEDIESKQIILVDEGSLLNAKHAQDLLIAAKNSGAKLFLLGDKDQHAAVEAGKPFIIMQAFGMQVTSVKTIIRQKNEELLNAVKGAINNNFTDSLNWMGENIVAGKDPRGNLVAEWLSLTNKERDKTLVIIPENKVRREYNSTIRDALQVEGVVSTNEISTRILLNSRMNHAKMRDARYYEKQHLIEFQKETQGIKPGFYEILSSNHKDNELTIRSDNKEVHVFSPGKLDEKSRYQLDVFEETDLKISKGDKLQWTKSRRELGLKNGDMLEVISTDNSKGTYQAIRENDGQTFELDAKQRLNVDYSYSLTSYKAQGKTCDRVFALLVASKNKLVNDKSFYVSISRAKHLAKIFTDSKSKLLDALNNIDSDKTTALEGFSKGQMKREAKDEKNIAQDNRKLHEAIMEVKTASEKLSAKQAVFSHTDLLKETMKWTLGIYDANDISDAIVHLRQEGNLALSSIQKKGEGSEHYYTSRNNVLIERELVVHLQQGKRRLAKLAPKGVIKSYVDSRNERALSEDVVPINESSLYALEAIFNSKDEGILVLGSDNTGHKNLLRTVGKSIAEHQEYKVHAFSTNNTGIKQMKEDGMKNAMSIFFHMDRIEKSIAKGEPLKGRRQLWYVENVSTLGAEETLRLQRLARFSGARLIMVADKNENALSWGAVPTLLNHHGMHTVNFNAVVMAHNPEINKASDALVKGQIEDSLTALSPMVHEIDSRITAEAKTERIGVVKDTYLNLSIEEREQTAIILPDHHTRHAVNSMIRDGLKAEKSLVDDGIETTVYRQVMLDPFEKKEARFYKADMVLEAESTTQNGIKGDKFTIVDVDKKNNTLELKSLSDDKSLIIKTKDIPTSKGNGFISYAVESREIVKGEKIRLTRAFPLPKKKGANKGGYLPKNAEAIVKDINISTGDLTLTLKNGQQITLNTQQWKHYEWGYTHNHYQVKDSAYKQVITIMESWKKHFATQNALHNTLTRSTHNLTIITDNKEKLFDTLRTNTGFQKMALDNKKVSVTKTDIKKFDELWGKSLNPFEKSITRLELAVNKAVSKFVDITAKKEINTPEYPNNNQQIEQSKPTKQRSL